MIMTKQNFYEFALMMKKDSNILFENNSLHNSVYLGAFVLEGYIKILLIHKNINYIGHINDKNNKFLNKLDTIKSLDPELFGNTILENNSDYYPIQLLSNKYNINYRYEVDKWTDINFVQDIQNEIQHIYENLEDLKIEQGW